MQMVDFLRGATIGEATEPGTGNIFFRDAVRTPNSTIFLNPYEDWLIWKRFRFDIFFKDMGILIRYDLRQSLAVNQPEYSEHNE